MTKPVCRDATGYARQPCLWLFVNSVYLYTLTWVKDYQRPYAPIYVKVVKNAVGKELYKKEI